MITDQPPVTVEEALRYDAESLQNGVEKAKNNIKIFEDAIDNEHRTITRYQEMIAIIKAHKNHQQPT